MANPFLPGDRRFFSRIHAVAAGPDGAVYLAAASIVSASETGLAPRASVGEWYADNGAGVWRMETDGRITAFAVHPNGNHPARRTETADCDARVQAAALWPNQWDGMAVAPDGDVYVSDREFGVILRLRRNGRVDRVAGGGDQACVRDPWKKTKEAGYRDGPARQSLFHSPRGLVFDRDGNLSSSCCQRPRATATPARCGWSSSAASRIFPTARCSSRTSTTMRCARWPDRG